LLGKCKAGGRSPGAPALALAGMLLLYCYDLEPTLCCQCRCETVAAIATNLQVLEGLCHYMML
jgi:hypothetical protein